MKRASRCFALILTTILFSQTASLSQQQQPAEIPLWPNGAPGARGNASADTPSITPYVCPTAPASGATVIVLPGGGYAALSMQKEGSDEALWFNQQGITAFVLKYRLGRDGYRHPSMLQDVSRAIRYVRANAEQYKIDPNRIGVMGSSAGGHLASTVMTHFDKGDPNSTDPIEKQGSRPDFGILCYPVITMGEKAHVGSRRMLLGDNPSPELITLLSNELQVTPDTPPCFIWHTLDDPVVPIENTIDFAMAMKKNKVPFDLHIYQHGSHGLGLGDRPPTFAHTLPWTADLVLWLKTNKFLPAQGPTTRPQ